MISESTKKNRNSAGWKWYNNGTESIRSNNPNNVPSGYTEGRLTGDWYNNGIKSIRVTGIPPDGFVKGRLDKNTTPQLHLEHHLFVDLIKQTCFDETGQIKSPNHSKEVFLKNNGLYDQLMDLTKNLDSSYGLGARLKLVYCNFPEHKKCERCGNPTTWDQQYRVYTTYCGTACSNATKNADPEFIKKQKIGIAQIDNSVKQANRRATTLARYGVDHISKVEDNKNKVRSTRFEKDELLRRFTFAKYKLDYEQMSNYDTLKAITDAATSYMDLSKRFFNEMPIMTIFRHFKHIKYDPKFEKQTSSQEKEISEFIQSLGFETEMNGRTLIKPLEIDIYVPDKKLAIEFNGFPWHCEYFGEKHRDYHLNKTTRCDTIGVQLLHINAEQWRNKSDIVKSIIQTKLGCNTRLFARDLSIINVDSVSAKNFLNENHIQGAVVGATVKLGLYSESLDRLVGLAIFGSSRFKKNENELLRFCSKMGISIVGGLSKLISAYRKANPGTLISYCDRSISNGNAYIKTGWRLKHITPPGYRYVMNESTFNRLRFQKHKLKNMIGYDPDRTEWEIMQDNGYDRYWDCGQFVFQLDEV